MNENNMTDYENDTNNNWFTYKGGLSYTDYYRLIKIAKEKGIISFDINDTIRYLIRNFPL